MTKRSLQRQGYSIKHTVVGWWVDGRCGYLVSGYHESEGAAIGAASDRIAQARSTSSRPAWLFH